MISASISGVVAIEPPELSKLSTVAPKLEPAERTALAPACRPNDHRRKRSLKHIRCGVARLSNFSFSRDHLLDNRFGTMMRDFVSRLRETQSASGLTSRSLQAPYECLRVSLPGPAQSFSSTLPHANGRAIDVATVACATQRDLRRTTTAVEDAKTIVQPEQQNSSTSCFNSWQTEGASSLLHEATERLKFRLSLYLFLLYEKVLAEKF